MLQILFRTKFCFFENIIGSKKNIVQKKLFAKNLFRETNITRGANIIGGGIIPRGPTLLCGDPPISPLALNIFVELNIFLAMSFLAKVYSVTAECFSSRWEFLTNPQLSELKEFNNKNSTKWNITIIKIIRHVENIATSCHCQKNLSFTTVWFQKRMFKLVR